MDCELAVNLKNLLGEGPVWDDRENALFWIDGLGQRWFRRDADGCVAAHETPSPIGSLVLAQSSGAAYMALQDGIYGLDTRSGALSFVCNPEAGVIGNRFNDGKCDPAGRYVVGSMSVDSNDGSAALPAGALYSVEPGGRWRTLKTGVGISNGMAWSSSGGLFYYIDSLAGCVLEHGYCAATGAIAGGRECVRIPNGEGIPDGMCIDEEGMLWVAQWGGWRVSRWNPQTGERISCINVPASHVTCCAFGGSGLDELYITTSTVGVQGDELERQPLAGALFVARPGVRGTRAFRMGERSDSQ